MPAALSLAEFTQAYRPVQNRRRSQLEPYTQDLLTLKRNGYSLAQMKTYLEGHKIRVTRAAISAFLVNVSKTAELQKAR